jgi:hypothetical protein
MKNFLLIILVAVAFTSCTYDKIEVGKPVISCDTTNITYSGTIKAIISTNCSFASDCHAQNGAGNGYLDNYNVLKGKIDNGVFKSRVLTPDGGMPPGYGSSKGALSDCDLIKLKIWVDKGAPNN